MDGNGCWRDSIFVERLGRSLEYEEVYLHAYDSVSDPTAGLGRYLTLYNTHRPHSSLCQQRRPQRALLQPARRNGACGGRRVRRPGIRAGEVATPRAGRTLRQDPVPH
jgi:putative transposase